MRTEPHADSGNQLLERSIVFIVDDEESVRRSMKWLFESVGLVVETFPSGDDFLARETQNVAGCILLDVRMPGTTAREVIVAVRERVVTYPVIVLTGHADVRIARDLISAGATDLIEKPARDQELIDKVQRAIDGNRKLRLDLEPHLAVLQGGLRLTEREFDVLELVVNGHTSREIAERLSRSQKTVETHRSHIMNKLGARNVPELVRLVFPFMDRLRTRGRD